MWPSPSYTRSQSRESVRAVEMGVYIKVGLHQLHHSGLSEPQPVRRQARRGAARRSAHLHPHAHTVRRVRQTPYPAAACWLRTSRPGTGPAGITSRPRPERSGRERPSQASPGEPDVLVPSSRVTPLPGLVKAGPLAISAAVSGVRLSWPASETSSGVNAILISFVSTPKAFWQNHWEVRPAHPPVVRRSSPL